jgi:phosphate-selective porin OprO and OprP
MSSTLFPASASHRRRAALYTGVAMVAFSLLIPGVASAASAASSTQETLNRLEQLEKRLLSQEQQIQQQRQQIEQQRSQILDLKNRSSAGFNEAKRQIEEQPKVSLANARPTFSTADGQFTASLRGLFHFDSAHYEQDSVRGTDLRRAATGGDAAEAARARDLNSGSNFRRARFGIEGTVLKDWNYTLLYEAGGSGQEDGGRITDFWLGYNGFAGYRLQIGALSPPSNLDDATSSNDSTFIERASPAELTRSLGAGDARYSLGLRTGADTYTVTAFLTGGTVNTPRDGSAAFPAVNSDEQLAFLGRGTFVPSKSANHLLHLGASVNWVFDPAQVADPSAAVTANRSPIRLRDRPELRVDGTRFIDTGNINVDSVAAYGVELAGNWKNFYGQGEYFYYDLDRKSVVAPILPSDVAFEAWYVQASWVLTGESKRYNAQNGAYGNPRAEKPFSLKTGDLGAIELAARYSQTDLNDRERSAVAAERIRGGEQTVVTLGLNWYPNSNIRFLLNYQFVDIDRLNPGGFTGALAVPDANAQIGQSFQAIALRSQLSF